MIWGNIYQSVTDILLSLIFFSLRRSKSFLSRVVIESVTTAFETKLPLRLRSLMNSIFVPMNYLYTWHICEAFLFLDWDWCSSLAERTVFFLLFLNTIIFASIIRASSVLFRIFFLTGWKLNDILRLVTKRYNIYLKKLNYHSQLDRCREINPRTSVSSWNKTNKVHRKGLQEKNENPARSFKRTMNQASSFFFLLLFREHTHHKFPAKREQ